jgi:hypothetical protein
MKKIDCQFPLILAVPLLLSRSGVLAVEGIKISDMDTYEKFREEIIQLCKENSDCKEEFKKLVSAETEAGFCTVLKDNFYWCVENNIVTEQTVTKYKEIFNRNSIYCNEDVENGYLIVTGKSKVHAICNSKVYARGNSKVYARGNSKVYATGKSVVYAYENSRVYAHGNSKVYAYDNSEVIAIDNSEVSVNDNSVVYAYDNSEVIAYDNSEVRARGNSEVYARGNSVVYAYENSKVIDYR